MAQYPARKGRSDDYQMMIITPASFVSAYQPLIDMYKIRGIKALTVTKEYITANMTGQDVPEKMRNYIIQEYQNHGVEYVLLGGDVDQIPFRGFYCYVISGSGYEDYNIPADIYYSALDGQFETIQKRALLQLKQPVLLLLCPFLLLFFALLSDPAT